MALVEAYDTKTGKKLPYLVPEEHFDHPFFGRRIAPLPSAAAAKADERVDPPPAEPGSPEEAQQLKGAALDDALTAADLDTTGRADEKRARLTEYRLNLRAAADPVTTETSDAIPGAADPTDTPDAGDN